MLAVISKNGNIESILELGPVKTTKNGEVLRMTTEQQSLKRGIIFDTFLKKKDAFIHPSTHQR